MIQKMRCFQMVLVAGTLGLLVFALKSGFIMDYMKHEQMASPHYIETFGSEKGETTLQEIKERSHRLQEACGKISHLRRNNKNGVELMKGNVYMCTANKIGSMFFLAFFKRYESLKGSAQKSRKHNIAFVRDPYSRLYSAYVDKLFSANPVFWKSFGRTIVSKRPKHRYVKCGSDVSFSELVDELIYRYDNEKFIDSHFQLLHGYCHFCKIHYDFIGKMETFVRDVAYLSDAVLAIKNEGFKQFLNQSLFGGAERMMGNNARNVYGSRLNGILECNVTLIKALKLTWKRWQMRGYIEPRFSFPETSTSSFPEFISKALELHRASDTTALAASKRSFLTETYNTLSKSQKLKLMEMFKPQFDMFGYDPKPDFVFGNQ